jgi:hypothetical protein
LFPSSRAAFVVDATRACPRFPRRFFAAGFSRPLAPARMRGSTSIVDAAAAPPSEMTEHPDATEVEHAREEF